MPPSAAAVKPPAQAELDAFQQFRKAMLGKKNLDRLEQAVAAAFAPLEERGLLAELTDELKDFDKKTILAYTNENPRRREIEVSDVTFDPKAIRQSLTEQLESKAIADRIYTWLEPRLLHPSKPLTTFTLDAAASQAAQDENASEVEPVVINHKAGEKLVSAGESIGKSKLDLLDLESSAYLAQRTFLQQASRSAAVLLVVFALFTLCGMYMRVRQRGVQAGLDRLAGALALAVATVFLAVCLAVDPYRAELAGVILFGMIVAIAYRQELALLFSGVVSWIVVLGLGGDLPMFLLLFGTTAAAALNLGRIRSRSKLVYVGLFAGGVAALLSFAMKLIDNQPLRLIDNQSLNWSLFRDAGRQFLWATAAGFIMTGLLPFVERLFGVLTDLSLLGTGRHHPSAPARAGPPRAEHLQPLDHRRLDRRSGGRGDRRPRAARAAWGPTSTTSARCSSRATSSRTRARKATATNTLVPAMSTLVIIAHIKDGADLARQHHLPQPIIDMIEQHHGTMLMEYFYDRAQTQQAADPNGGEVDENLFRYPGPKPQTKEAAVLMLADAVESASRTLVDPTPGRIESLVRDLAQRRLQDGQFDESGLTLRELGTIERSLAMSVASIYHGRLKYPEQRTA